MGEVVAVAPRDSAGTLRRQDFLCDFSSGWTRSVLSGVREVRGKR